MSEGRTSRASAGAAALPATAGAARAAAARLFVRSLVALLGRWLTIGIGVGCALLMIDRLVGPARGAIPAWALLGGTAALGAAYAVWLAVSRRAGAVEAAATLDRALGLRDRLSSALALAGEPQSPEDPAFVALAHAEAERAAPAADARKAIPVSFSNAWWACGTLCGLGILAAMFVPRFDLLRPGAAKVAAHERALVVERESAAQAIEAAQADAKKALAESAASGATPEQVAALNQIARQLQHGSMTAEEGRAAAAAGLDDAAQRLEEEQAQTRRQMDALGERLSGVGRGRGGEKSEGQPQQAQELEDALRRGDFEAAAESLDKVDRALRDELHGAGGTEAEKAALKEALSRISKDLDAAQAAEEEKQKEPGGARPTPEEKSLQDMGLSPDEAKKLASETDEKAVRDALEKKGVAPEAAQRAAEKSADAAKQREAEKEADRKAKELRDALKDAAKENPGQGGKKDSPSPSPSQQEKKDAAQPDGKKNDGAGEKKDGQKDGEKPGEKPGDKQGDARSGEKQEQKPGDQQSSGDKQDKDGAAKPSSQGEGEKKEGGEEKQGQAPSKDGKGNDPNSPQTSPSADPNSPVGSEKAPAKGDQKGGGAQEQQGKEGQPGAKGAPESKDQQGEGKSGERHGEKPGGSQHDPNGKPGDAQGQPKDKPGGKADGKPSGSGMQRAKDALEKLAKDQRAADAAKKAAENLRKQAQDVANGGSKGKQNEQWKQALEKENEGGGAGKGDPSANGGGAGTAAVKPGAHAGAPDASGEFRTESVDARRGAKKGESDEAERVAAEWFNPDGTPKRGGPSGGAASGEAVREAASAAERAIEEQRVPRRHAQVVRKFFQKLPESAKPASPAQPPPATQPAPPPAQPPAPAPADAKKPA